MSTIRRKRENRFTIIPNSIFNDANLSLEAKGMIGWLLSRPDDWIIRLEYLGDTFNIGREKTQRIFRELISAGYVIRNGQTRHDGQWAHTDYVVYDETQPQSENPTAEKSTAENPTAYKDSIEDTKTQDYQNQENKTRARDDQIKWLNAKDPETAQASNHKTEAQPSPVVATKHQWPADYKSQFWAAYPHKVGRAPALAALDAVAKRGDIPFDFLLRAVWRYASKQDDRMWCNPAKWLFEERWMDVPAPRPDGRRQANGAII